MIYLVAEQIVYVNDEGGKVMYDVAIVGGGPAGMNAALVLGRGLKTVILFDEENPRNKVTNESHGWIGLDGISPIAFRKKGRKDLDKYTSVNIRNTRILKIKVKETSFVLTDSDGKITEAKKIILATGIKETLPTIPKIEDYYGKSLFSCPFCDGYELKDERVVLITENEHAMHLIQLVYNWNKQLIVCTNGSNALSEEDKHILSTKHIPLVEETIEGLIGANGRLEAVAFENGKQIQRTAGFITTEIKESNPFVDQLQLKRNEYGFIETDVFGRTSQKGIYAAGDITSPSNLLGSAEQGSKAGVGIIFDFVSEEFDC